MKCIRITFCEVMILVTSRDVARLAKVSQATVSRVFSNTELVSLKTQKKVLEAAKELNYSPNWAARSLKSNKSHTIGMIISSYDSIFYSAVTRRVEKHLRSAGLRLLTTFSSENPDTEIECFNSLISSRVDAIVYTPVSLKNQHLNNLAKRFNCSLLQLYRKAYKNISSLTIDDAYGTYLATKRLLESGHQKILLVDYSTSVPTHRRDGYIRAYTELGKDFSGTMIFYFNPDPEANEYPILEKKLTDTNPTAIIAVTAITGLYLLKYCKDNNINIPEDLSLVVYDDSKWAQVNDISVISHPYDEIASEIANSIISLTNSNKKQIQHKQIKPFYIERQSINDNTQ